MKRTMRKVTFTALCIALGLVLPGIFHIFGLGKIFLPMHIPVYLCGFIVGPLYGLVCGLITPILSSVLTGMPVFYPNCIVMCAELMTYGFLAGLLYQKAHLNIYLSLLLAIIAGRCVAGLFQAILLGLGGTEYSISAFVSANIVSSLPGSIVQIIVVPLLVYILVKARLTQFIN